ncbi:uncharacterized protein LOC112904163 [Agrilus planipennis]|nr:uncharacterized protein LOC112904163 [Agrilus planipennis]
MYIKIMKLPRYRKALQVFAKLSKLKYTHIYLFQSLLNEIVHEDEFTKLWKKISHDSHEDLEDITDYDIWSAPSKVLDDNKNRYKKNKKKQEAESIKVQTPTIRNQFKDDLSPIITNSQPIINFHDKKASTTHHHSVDSILSALKNVTRNISLLQERKRSKRRNEEEGCNCRKYVKGNTTHTTPSKPADECTLWLHGYKYYILNLQ